MNESIKNLTERRSVRKFKPEQIREDELEAILKAGIYAPSAHGWQSARIVAIQKPEIIRKLSQMNARILGVSIDPFYGAPTLILVLGDKGRPTYIEDGSLVIGNLMNAAHAIGVDSCWINRAREEFESPEGKQLLKEWGIEGDYAGIGHCVLGYGDCEYPKAAPRKEDYIIRLL